MAACPECHAQLDSMYVSGCWKCGAGFRARSNWKPVSSGLVPGAPSDFPLVPGIRSIALFTAPVWGIVLAVLLLSITGDRGPGGGGLLLVVGALLPFAFLPRIWDGNSFGAVGKVFLSILYYAASCVAMFVAGWATLIHVFGAT